MARKEKKVIFLNNVKSEYIEQAIIVLKNKKSDTDDASAEHIILEAERIVESYSQKYFGHGEDYGTQAILQTTVAADAAAAAGSSKVANPSMKRAKKALWIALAFGTACLITASILYFVMVLL